MKRLKFSQYHTKIFRHNQVVLNKIEKLVNISIQVVVDQVVKEVILNYEIY